MAITPTSTSRRRNSTSSGTDFRTSFYETPSRTSSRAGGVLSPPLSAAISTGYASSTVTSAGTSSKMNIVTRVAIEGKEKPGRDGASVTMYLKMTVSLESITPGQTIQLFPEENVKIIQSVIHPLDSNGVPYHFDSKDAPLLHSAGRALNLPARSQQTFYAASGISPPTASSSIPIPASSSRPHKGGFAANGSAISPVDSTYVGHVLVSGYHVSYVLPKVFPRPLGEDASTSSTTGSVRSSGKYGGRRISIGDRDRLQAHFVAAIDLWVPFASQPPRSPYLLSIPTPRCLNNNIKLRIFPPATNNISASLASLSSLDEDHAGAWDLTSDPHVTRTVSSKSKATANGYGSNSLHGNEADDESSDSSTAGFSYGCGIQGSFPSAERIRVRWAKPVKELDIPRYGEDSSDTTQTGRRRVGVKEVTGEMSCIVKGKTQTADGAEGVVMDVEYKGTCKDVWYPGVATLLGMDVSLEAKNSDVAWFDGEGSPGTGWEINGGTGYTGFDVGNGWNPRQAMGRFDSMDSNSGNPQIQIPPLGSHPGLNSNTSSSSSLLRAPLPAMQNVVEYSFEGAASPPEPSASMISQSSLGSLATSVNLSQSSASRLPGHPITLHLNMNELLPPAKNEFTFSIKGTLVVIPRTRYNPSARANGSSKNRGSGAESDETTSGSSPDDREVVPVTLPRFTVLAADRESTSVVIRNDVGTPSASVEVYRPDGDIHSDAQARKTVLQRGGFTKCGQDGGRIVVKMPSHPYSNGRIGIRTDDESGRSSPVSGPSHGHVLPRASSQVNLAKYGSNVTQKMRPKRDGDLMIPWVDARVTPLSSDSGTYAVRVRLPAPADMNGNDWLEFGLAKPGSTIGSSSISVGKTSPPNLDIVSVSVDGVPVKYEATAAAVKDEAGVEFEEMSTREWISWVRVKLEVLEVAK